MTTTAQLATALAAAAQQYASDSDEAAYAVAIEAAYTAWDGLAYDTPAGLAQRQAAIIAELSPVNVREFLAWLNGTVNGGTNGDGRYPLTIGGVAVLVYCPAALKSVGDNSGRRLTFSTTTTDADPGAALLRFNNATLASVTQIFVDLADLAGGDLTSWLDSLDDSTSTSSKGVLTLLELSTAKVWTFKLTAVTTATGYRKLTVAAPSGTGLPGNGGVLAVSFTPTGDAGNVSGSRLVSAAGLATGGGDLTADRTVTVPAATNAQAKLGSSTAVAMTPAADLAAQDGLVNILERIVEQTPTSTLQHCLLAARIGLEVRAAGNAGNSAQYVRKGLSNSTALTDIITLVRATVGTAEAQSGLVSSFASGVARITTWGALIEPAATNLVTASKTFTTGWTTDGTATIAQAQAVAADGATTAIQLQRVSGGGYAYGSGTVVNGATYTDSVDARLGTGGNGTVTVTAGAFAAVFNLNTGQVVSNTGVSARMRPLSATGLWRCEMTWVAASTTQIYGVQQGGSFTSGQGHYFSDYQRETGSVATSRITTTTAAVTRNKDDYSTALAIAAGQAFTVFGRVQVPVFASGTYPVVLSLFDAGQANTLQLFFDLVASAPHLRIGGISNASAAAQSSSLAAGASGQVVAFAITVSRSTVSLSVNGSAPVTFTLPGGAYGAFATLNIGRDTNGNSQMGSYFRGLWYDPRAYSTTEARCAATFDPVQAAVDIAAGRDPVLFDTAVDFIGTGAPTYKAAGADYAALTDLPVTAFTRATVRNAATVSGYLLAFASGVLAITDRGLRFDPQTQNLLLNNATLSTQSVTVTAAAHTLQFTGTGTVTLSGASTAGPLVGTGALNTVTLTFTPTAGSLTLTVTGSVTNAQLELGSVATAPVTNTGVANTRNEDVWLTVERNVAAYGRTVKFTPRDLTGVHRIWHYDDGTTANYVSLYTTGTSLKLDVVNASSTTASITLGTVAVGTTYAVSFRIANNDIKAWLNGATAGTPDTSCAVPATAYERLGRGSAGETFVGEVLTFRRPNRALVDAQLAAIAA